MPVNEPKRIRERPTSELATLLADARSSGESILVDTGETVYPLRVRPPAGLLSDGDDEQEVTRLWAEYDPAKVREALRASAGALAGVNVEDLIGDVYLQRDQDRPEWAC